MDWQMTYHEIDGNEYTTEELRSSQHKALNLQHAAARLEGEVPDAEVRALLANVQVALRAVSARLEKIIVSNRKEIAA